MPASPQTITLRLSGKAGRARIDGIDVNSSSAELYAAVLSKLNSTSEVVLLVEGRVIDRSCRSIWEAGLRHGTMIEVRGGDGAIAGITGAKRREGKIEDEEKKNFLNFDAWLKRRNYDMTSLDLGTKFSGVHKDASGMIKLPPAVSLKHQGYRHIDHVEFANSTGVRRFISYWRTELLQRRTRVGILFGYFAEYEHYDQGIKAVVEGVYEPEQRGEEDLVQWDIDSPELKALTESMAQLGIEPVGLIIAHPDKNCFLRSRDVVMSAEWAVRNWVDSHFSGYIHSRQVVVSVSSKEDNPEPDLHAFAITDLGVAMCRDGILKATDDSQKLTIREPSTESEILPPVLEGGNELKSGFQVEWLLVRLNDSAPTDATNLLCVNEFPPLSRIKLTTSHINLVPDEGNARLLADFQVLCWLRKNFRKSEWNLLAKAIRERGDIPPDVTRRIRKIKRSCAKAM